MKRFLFDAAAAPPITQFGSSGATIIPIVRPGPGAVQVVCILLAPDGHIGRHRASAAQLFLVVAGGGWVAGADGLRDPIKAGEAAYWEDGEAHESGSERGMTVLVVESESLDPAAWTPEVEHT